MPTQRRARPAGDPQRNQGDAGHARNRYGDAGKCLAQQQLPDQRRDDQQRQSCGGFGDGGESQHAFFIVSCRFHWPAALDRIRLGAGMGGSALARSALAPVRA